MADDGGAIPELKLGEVLCDETTIRNIAAWFGGKLPRSWAGPAEPMSEEEIRTLRSRPISFRTGSIIMIKNRLPPFPSELFDTHTRARVWPPSLVEHGMPPELLASHCYALPDDLPLKILLNVVFRLTREELEELATDTDFAQFSVKAATLVARKMGMPAPLKQMTLEEYAGYRREAALLARAR